MHQYASIPGHSTCCYAELTSSIIACHLLNLWCRERYRGRHTNNPSGHHPIWNIGAPTSNIPHFYAECPFCHNPPNLSRFGNGHRIVLACIHGGLVSVNSNTRQYVTAHYCSCSLVPNKRAGTPVTVPTVHVRVSSIQLKAYDILYIYIRKTTKHLLHCQLPEKKLFLP